MAGAVNMLPALRGELSLHPGPAEPDGAPTWTIRDPVRNRFFRLSWPAFEILSRWGAGDPAAVAAQVRDETTLDPDEDDVADIARFLVANQLTQPQGTQDTRRLIARAEAERQSWFHWLLHHYLFFRIPLVRPDRWLGASLPLVRWLGSGWFRAATVAALGLGVILAGRQWDLFAVSLVDTLSLSGLVSYGIALSVVKVIHELAHAYTAKTHGGRVPSMGVAFLVMWPVLYTDVNDTWLMPERRKRLQVGSAGIVAELTVAAWATLAWTFLPEGPWKQGAFVLATLTWVSSLVINLSPFMRFDGYFIAMDALEMPNLHPRAFAMATWWLREMLFGLGGPPPEPLSAARRHALVAFAVAVWVYRLVLFLGIAVLVYHFFIKAVGVVLFVVEIGWFVVLPIWNEMRRWGQMKAAILAGRRVRWTLGAAGGALLVALIPWQSTVEAPAVLKPARTKDLYLPFPARLDAVAVVQGQRVEAGAELMRFSSPDLELRKAATAARIAGRRAALDAATLDPLLRGQAGVAQEDLRKAEAELAALVAESARLVLVAPENGFVYDLLPGIAPGDWLSPRQALGIVVADAPPVAVAYVAESDLSRIAPDAEARFVPVIPEQGRRSGRVSRVDPAPTKVLADESLASIHHGPIPSRVVGRQVVPDGAVTRVTVTLDGSPPAHETMGTLTVAAERSSLVGRLARSVLIVLIREWGV